MRNLHLPSARERPIPLPGAGTDVGEVVMLEVVPLPATEHVRGASSASSPLATGGTPRRPRRSPGRTGCQSSKSSPSLSVKEMVQLSNSELFGDPKTKSDLVKYLWKYKNGAYRDLSERDSVDSPLRSCFTDVLFAVQKSRRNFVLQNPIKCKCCLLFDFFEVTPEQLNMVASQQNIVRIRRCHFNALKMN